jgi:hypothetical protein
MPELLAGDIGWLGAGWLFAWVFGTLARLAAGEVPRAARFRSAESRAKPRCRRRLSTPPVRAARSGMLALALLPLIAAGAAGSLHAVVPAAAGAVCGAWLARRYGRIVRPRFVSMAGCALGAATVAGGFAAHLLMPRLAVLERGALFVAVSLGAWMLAASVSVWFAEFAHHDGGTPARRRQALLATAAQSAFDDRITYGLALTLCAALAYGFMAADTSAPLRLAALVAASGLTAVLGVRTMVTGRPSRAPVAAPHPCAVAARTEAGSPARLNLVSIPDEWLVAACGGETFDAACLFPFGAAGGARDGSHYSALPRRQRGRYGHAARAGERRAH